MKKKYINYKIFKTKYFWISLSFFIWMFFFDTNSLILHWKLKKTMNKMILDRDYLKNKIFLEGDHLKKLNNNPKYLEKIAREKFYMKKEDEDLFILSKT
ncbi:septum formation initiator family protein [Blattabacterium punctulatus]|uniref:FtsB family cell division protein n=1 Tax=Blattabacterium punctulatus TaxID=164514 RepID=UPI000D7BDBFF|nr:septum formation initiator family protein [Blattabacterium punctulatus]AWU42818.1 septum formation initiator family protein [Blattabacterium punctulatus]